jgi:hypothetical protein
MRTRAVFVTVVIRRMARGGFGFGGGGGGGDRGRRDVHAQEGPRHVINCVLLVGDRLDDRLCAEVVVQDVVKVRLDRQREAKELLQEVFLRRLAHDDTST